MVGEGDNRNDSSSGDGGGDTRQDTAAPADAHAILQPAIDAMSAHIAVLDPDGTIMAVNERWRRFADENDLRLPAYALSMNYFGASRLIPADAQGGPDPQMVFEGIRGVLAGRQEEFRAVYPCHSPDVRRWFHMRVTPFVHGGVRRAVVSHANVTPLIEASEALRESEQRFRSIADTVPVFIYMLTPQGGLEFINKPLHDYHGLTLEELAGQGITAPLHPDDLPAAAVAFATAFQDPRPITVEHRMRRRDGEYRWFINQAVPRHAEDGGYLGYIGCCIDVHERKLAERAVEANERRYRTIFHSAAIAMWESDFSGPSGMLEALKARGVGDLGAYLRANPDFVTSCAAAVTVRNVNDAAVRWAGAASREELLGHFAELFVPETFDDFIEELVGLAEERGEFQRETSIRTLRGEVRRCVFTISLPPAAPVTSILAAAMDVTDQRRAEDALHKSEALNRAVLGSLKELIAVLDGDGRIIAVNQAWSDFARQGGGTDVSVGVGANYLEVVARASASPGSGGGGADASDDATQAAQALSGIRGVLAGERAQFETEYRCAMPSGERWFSMTVVPLRGGAGPGAVVVHTDITDRKEAQHLMQALNARLLRAQEDERRRLAREMHDDVTQRLAVLAIEAGRLEMQLGSRSSGASADDAAIDAQVRHKLRQMTEHMVKLSSDVHAISRQLHPSILDDLGLAEAVESECHAFTDREGIAVKLDMPPMPEPIPKDAALVLYRILQESLRNVAKHAQTDRVRVSLTRAGRDDGGGEIVLRIEDNGVGFDTTRARTSVGLGLASMRERVRLVDGQLEVRSAAGRGAAVEVRVPVQPRSTDG